MELTRKQIYEMGTVCAQLGLTTPEEVQKCMLLGARVGIRAERLRDAYQILRELTMAVGVN